MPDRALVETFAARVEAGDYLGAIQDFYAVDATMQENLEAPRVGRDVLLEHERRILAGVEAMGATRLGRILIEGDQVVIRWRFVMVTAQGPDRELEEVAWQTWRDGRIVAEQFYYDPSQLRS